MIPSDTTTEPLPRRIITELTNWIGVCENPVGSNRGVDVDMFVHHFGGVLGSYWCAFFVGYCFDVSGAKIPSRHLVGSCDEWVKWAKKNNLWSAIPFPGAAVVYTNRKVLPSGELDAVHIGGITRKVPIVQSIEGNTSTGGFEWNGYTVALKEPDRQKVLGYVIAAAK